MLHVTKLSLYKQIKQIALETFWFMDAIQSGSSSTLAPFDATVYNMTVVSTKL